MTFLGLHKRIVRERPADRLMVDELRRSMASLMDVVEELCEGLASEQVPTQEWAGIVKAAFKEHRVEIGVS